MKKTFSRFQIAYIHVILLLLSKNKIEIEDVSNSHYKLDYSLHVSSNML